MRKYWYRRILIMIVTFTVAVGGGYYLIESKHSQLRQEVSAGTSSGNMVIPGGMPIGIYLETQGVMVLGTDAVTAMDGMEYEPASHLVKAGDYIVALDEEEISSKSQLVDAMKKIDKEEVVLKVRRSEDLIDIKLKPVRCSSKDYKLGIWVRDNAQGLGTITFLNADSQFGDMGFMMWIPIRCWRSMTAPCTRPASKISRRERTARREGWKESLSITIIMCLEA